MIIDNIYKKVTYFKSLPEDKKIIIFYRYISLFITSTAFLISDLQHSIEKRVFIIICISISSVILNYLYVLNHQSLSIIKLLILIETIGNSVLLIPCGGFGTPYVWYALNTILISSIMLSRKYCWFNLFIYLFCTTWISYILFFKESSSFIKFLYLESNLIVSSFLMTIAINLLAKYINNIKAERVKLISTNLQLINANEKVKESFNHIMDLYQTVHLFTSTQSKEELIEYIRDCLAKITKSRDVLFCCCCNTDAKFLSHSSKFCEHFHNEISKILHRITNSPNPVEVDFDGKIFLLASVNSNSKFYGVIGVEKKADFDIADPLLFVAELSSIAFEKFEMERINERLIVTEEQNRIANVIHDSVLQRLFSISFGVYGLMKELDKSEQKCMVDQLDLIRKSIDNSMKDLRSTIYDLSWKQGGSDCFIADIASYLNEIKKLSSVLIDFNTTGSSDFLNASQKKVLYRIICEGVGNAFRHGEATQIQILLHIEADETSLEIIDNGFGFDLDEVRRLKKEGLGIRNIHHLVHSLKGEVYYQSAKGMGTKIKISVPNRIPEFMEEKAI